MSIGEFERFFATAVADRHRHTGGARGDSAAIAIEVGAEVGTEEGAVATTAAPPMLAPRCRSPSDTPSHRAAEVASLLTFEYSCTLKGAARRMASGYLRQLINPLLSLLLEVDNTEAAI